MSDVNPTRSVAIEMKDERRTEADARSAGG